MRKYALDQTSALMGRLAFEIHRTAKMADAGAVHDLRTSIRRFSQCLRLFREFLPNKDCKKLRRRLRKMMDLTAEVRDRDIALEVLKSAALPDGSRLRASLSQQRKQAKRELMDSVKRWNGAGFSRKWRNRLNL